MAQAGTVPLAPAANAAGHGPESPGMLVIWLNGTVGSGKSAVGQALATLLPSATFLDGDDFAGLQNLPGPVRWRMALDALLRRIVRPGRARTLVVAYPLAHSGYLRLRATCGRASRSLCVVNLDTPLPILLRGRGERRLSANERARAREMRSEGYHRRRFASFTLANACHPAMRTARIIGRLMGSSGGVSIGRCVPEMAGSMRVLSPLEAE